MFKYNKALILAVSLGLLIGCEEYSSTESGLTYKYEVSGEGKTPENGNILIMNVSYIAEDGSEIFSTTSGGGPMAISYDDSLLNRDGGLEEGLRMIKDGDSLVLQYPVEDLFEGTFQLDLPDTLVRGSNVTVCIGVEHVFNEEEFQAFREEETEKRRKEMLAESSSKIESDGEIIDAYLAENGLEAEVHESGIRYTVLEEGEGDFPQRNQMVSVAYAGKVLDGRYFDTSYEEVAKAEGLYNPGRPYSPYQFSLGTGSVIQGWDIGIGLLRPGGKAVLYIPSSLAYGPQARSEVIGADEILIFDVELVEVTE
jgi:FKBP-type peptidyl-prolyl cis-trans isomerase